MEIQELCTITEQLFVLIFHPWILFSSQTRYTECLRNVWRAIIVDYSCMSKKDWIQIWSTNSVIWRDWGSPISFAVQFCSFLGVASHLALGYFSFFLVSDDVNPLKKTFTDKPEMKWWPQMGTKYLCCKALLDLDQSKAL